MPRIELMKPRILLLDGHSLAYRAFFALPVENFKTSTGQHTNAIYGFASMILNLIREGLTNHEIASELGFSESTIRQETMRIYQILKIVGDLNCLFECKSFVFHLRCIYFFQ